jgi:hypothetical protein
LCPFRQAVLTGGAEHTVGAELEEGGDALRLEGAHAVEEADGMAHVTCPGLWRGELVRGGELSGEVGDDGDARREERERAGDTLERLQHGVHVGRMESVADEETSGLASEGLEVLSDGEDGVVIA